MAEKTAFFKRKDMIILLVLLAVACAARLIYSYNNKTGDNPCARLYYMDEPIKTMYLNQNARFVPEQAPEVEIEVSNGAVRFVRSNCPDQICVKAGALFRNGDFAACLPNGLSLRVDGNKDGPYETDVDIIMK